MKPTKDVQVGQGSKFVTGYNEATLESFGTVTTTKGNWTVAQFRVKDDPSQFTKDVFITTKDDEAILSVCNMILTACNKPTLVAGVDAGAPLDACKGTKVGVLMYPQPNKEGKMFHDVLKNGIHGDIMGVVHASRIGETVDVEDLMKAATEKKPAAATAPVNTDVPPAAMTF